MKKLNLKESRLVLQLAKQLKENILERYHNVEYWHTDIIEGFKHDNNLTDKQINKIVEFLERTIYLH